MLSQQFQKWFRFFALVGLLELQAAPPRLEVPTLSAGQVNLRLLGEAGPIYRIEASPDLVQWTEVTTGPAQNGLLTATQVVPAQPFWTYYRAREVPVETPYPSVSAGLSPDYTAATLITPELGGRLQIFSPEGVGYTLVIPTNAVFAATLARMTVITNITGIPAAAGFLSAVQLEPAGLLLASPTFLHVTYPTNLLSPEVASYSFENNGTQFHLSPDLVGTNRVRLLVNQFRSYGSGRFTVPELQALLATGPAPNAQTRRTRVQPHATMAECYPEEEAEAEAMKEELTEAIRPLQEEIAGELAIERQRQLLGVFEEEEVGSPGVQEAIAKGANWYAENIVPRIANAGEKCAVAKELLFWILGWERQLQLFGAAGEDPGLSEGMGLVCKATARCQEQILECCRTRGADKRLLIELLGLERQRQLLGMTDGLCGSLSEEEWQVCVPEWYGELKVTEKLDTSYDQSTPDFVNRGSDVKTFELSAYVDSVEEDIVEAFPLFEIPASTNIVVKLSGQGLGAHTITAFQKSSGPICAGSRTARASAQPLDGGVDGFLRNSQLTSSVSKLVDLEIRVTLTDGTGGVFAPKPGLTFLMDALEAPWKGLTRSTYADFSSGSCQEKTDETRPTREEDFYANFYVDAGVNEFQYTGREIKYTKTTRENGLTREIVLRLNRKN